ncbi:MAG: cardiolipin synthase [Clostridia bacterium]|nr:cardiolipin synthase [Clostridia bacterium]
MQKVKVKNNRGIRLPIRFLVSIFLLIVQMAVISFFAIEFALGSVVAFLVMSLIATIVVCFIINRRGNPDHKIAWITFILVFPIFGITVFLLWGGGRIMPHIKKKMRICESHYMPYLKNDSDIKESLKYHDLIHSRQADYLTGETGFPIYDKTISKFYPSGEELLPALLKELSFAEKYIYIEFFILAEGVMWDKIHSVLKEKAANGVEVKIIFDDFGSIKRQSKGFIKKLKAEGIAVSVFNPINPFMNIFMNNRNHRKIIIIDGKTAFTGGVNIGDEYINEIERFGHWLDSGLIFRGEAVTSMLVMFCSMWEFTTGEQIDIKKHISGFFTENDGFIIPYNDDPLNDKNPAEGIYMQILNTAKKYVYIVTPYLIIDNNMKNTLCMAAKSGIDIRIITPHIPDKWYVHPVTQYNYLELLEEGVRIYEYTPGFIHSKLFVSDDKVATVGSVNMDYRSFVFHFECGAWLCDNNTVLDIKEHFCEVLNKCEEIKIDEWKKRPLKVRFKQAVLHIFAPFM